MDCRNRNETNLGELRPFALTSAVRDGCVLSSLLFITYIYYVCKDTNEGTEVILIKSDFQTATQLNADTSDYLQH